MLKVILALLLVIFMVSSLKIPQHQLEQHDFCWFFWDCTYDCRTSNAMDDYVIRVYVTRERLQTQETTLAIDAQGKVTIDASGVPGGQVGAGVKYTRGKKLKTDESYTQLSSGSTRAFTVDRSGNNFQTITIVTPRGQYVILNNEPISEEDNCRNVVYRDPKNNYVIGVIAKDRNFRFKSRGNTGSSKWTHSDYPPGYS